MQPEASEVTIKLEVAFVTINLSGFFFGLNQSVVDLIQPLRYLITGVRTIIKKLRGLSMPFRFRSILLSAATCVIAASMNCAHAQTFTPGVDMSGMELNTNKIPGTLYYDYVTPSIQELEYYHAKGLNLIRLPIAWERLEPGLLAQSPTREFNMTYLAQIEQILSLAASQKMTVVIDMHDYGAYAGQKLGSNQWLTNCFDGVWRHLARELVGNPGLAGYDLMNEPNGMPSPKVWPHAAQAALNAIRTVDMVTPIYVEGDDWASAGSWTNDNENLSITDPAGKLTYEAHVYGDSDNSGTHFDWDQEVQAGVTVNTIAQRVAVFSGWCKAKHNRCMIGEIGVGNDNAAWNTELANGLSAMQSGGLQSFTYWAGGPWWGGYPMSIEPTGSKDALQMAVVGPYGQ